MKLIYFEGCAHWQLADERLAHAIDYAGVGDVAVGACRSPHTTRRSRSACASPPTILVDGIDPFAEPALSAGLSCRISSTEHCTDGAPSVVQLIDALRRAAGDVPDARDITDEQSFPASDPPEAGAPGL